jgi:hypothetical protein
MCDFCPVVAVAAATPAGVVLTWVKLVLNRLGVRRVG